MNNQNQPHRMVVMHRPLITSGNFNQARASNYSHYNQNFPSTLQTIKEERSSIA